MSLRTFARAVGGRAWSALGSAGAKSSSRNRKGSTRTGVLLPGRILPFLSANEIPDQVGDDVKYILEPDAEALVAQLLPQVMLLKFHAAILDSAAAEQAARTIAMQTATDNAEDLLGELTLEYNKGRQQKITAEILDLLGGSQ